MQNDSNFIKVILESLPHPFYVIDVNNYQIILANSAANKLGKIVNKTTCFALTHNREKACDQEHVCPIEEVRKTKKPVVVEHIHYDENGMPRNMEIYAYPVFDDQGNVVQMIEYSLDITESRREKEILKAQRFIGGLIESLADGLSVINPDGVRVMVNQSYCDMTGFSREELLHSPVPFPVWPPEHMEDIKKAFEKLLKGELAEAELIFMRKTGERFPVLVTPSYMRNKEGELECFITSIKDITERKRIEGALRESESKYRSLFENAPEGILVADAETRVFKYANSAICSMLGYSEEELVLLGVKDIHPREHLQRVIDDFEARARGDKALLSDIPCQRKDGTVFFADISTTPVVMGGRGMMIGFFTDVTVRKQTENIMRARLRLLEYSVSHSTEELLVNMLDRTEILTGSQVGFYHFLEEDQKTLSFQAWSTRTTREMCTAEGKGRHYDLSEAGVWVDCVYQRRAVIHNDYASLAHRKGLPQGHSPIIRILVVPVLRDDRIVAVLGVGNKPGKYDETDVQTVSNLADLAWDIVDRKRSEEQLLEMNKRLKTLDQLKSDFVSTVSHEIRQPMTVIMGWMQQMERGMFGAINDEQKRWFDLGLKSVHRLARLIDDLLDISRIESGKIKLVKKDVDMVEIINEVLTVLSEQIENMGLEIRRDFPNAVIHLNADRDRMVQVWTNLIGNAVKFTEKGFIQIRIKEEGDHIACAAIDSGCGIAEKDLPRMFGKFERFTNPFGTKKKGSGLGLAITKGIIEAHQGHIEVKSSEGQGTQFIFTLPKH